MGKVSVSPLSPQWVLERGVATVFSAPARIRMKKECFIESEIEIGDDRNKMEVPQPKESIRSRSTLPGLLAVAQTKSALRGNRIS